MRKIFLKRIFSLKTDKKASGYVLSFHVWVAMGRSESNFEEDFKLNENACNSIAPV